MTATQHTPGPWRIYDASDDCHIKILGTYPKPSRIGNAHVADVLGHSNANLIAAAPELLEALEDVCNQSDAYREATGSERSRPAEKVYQKARAAIARARVNCDDA
jgi:hypothetical protein